MRAVNLIAIVVVIVTCHLSIYSVGLFLLKVKNTTAVMMNRQRYIQHDTWAKIGTK